MSSDKDDGAEQRIGMVYTSVDEKDPNFDKLTAGRGAHYPGHDEAIPQPPRTLDAITGRPSETNRSVIGSPLETKEQNAIRLERLAANIAHAEAIKAKLNYSPIRTSQNSQPTSFVERVSRSFTSARSKLIDLRDRALQQLRQPTDRLGTPVPKNDPA